MAVIAQYVINEGGIEARNDGTGLISHDLYAQYSKDDGETWVDIYHHTVVTPGAESEAIIDAGVQVKANYRALLTENWHTSPSPTPPPALTSGDLSEIRAYVAELEAWQAARDAANAVSDSAAEAVNAFVPSWPVTFEVN